MRITKQVYSETALFYNITIVYSRWTNLNKKKKTDFLSLRFMCVWMVMGWNLRQAFIFQSLGTQIFLLYIHTLTSSRTQLILSEHCVQCMYKSYAIHNIRLLHNWVLRGEKRFLFLFRKDIIIINIIYKYVSCLRLTLCKGKRNQYTHTHTFYCRRSYNM